MAEKTRYSDEELEEFKVIINEKLATARHDYNQMMRQLMNADGNDVDDTSPTYKVLEEGSATQTKEELIMQASRLQKFIQGLEAALVRVQNKTYGLMFFGRVGGLTLIYAAQTAPRTGRGRLPQEDVIVG